jgi:threonine/homoserine/homoserine lactone efflux protein
MEYLAQLLTLSGIVLLACISPGPDFVAVTSHALSDRRAGFRVALGIASAVFCWALLTVLGFGLLMEKMAWLYQVIRIAGALYLAYIGARMLMAALRGGSALASGNVDAASAFRKGFFVSMTNPKTAAFFGSLFFTILPLGAPVWVYAMAIMVVTLMTCAWMCFLAAFFSGKAARIFYERVRRPVDLLMGAALIALGLRLAITR